MDDGDLEQGSVGQDVFGELADEGDVVDHLFGDAPADVANDHRGAELEAEEVRRVDARVKACDHEQPQGRKHDRALVAAGRREGAVARKRRLDASRSGLGAVW